MYAKIFRQMYDGTLATNGPWEALVTFQQMLVLANDQGEVDMTPASISRITTVPLEIIERGIDALSKPDPESRTPDHDGRRIMLLSDGRSWGWKIVNYEKYRMIQKEAERRDYHRAYYHAKRKKTPDPVESQQFQQSSTVSTVSTDTEAEAEAKNTVSGASLSPQQPSTISTLKLEAPIPPPPAPPEFTGKNAEAFNGKTVAKLSGTFELPTQWGFDAEKLGFEPRQVIFESERFRQYWTEGKGANSRKTMRGWRQAWSNWLQIAANRGTR